MKIDYRPIFPDFAECWTQSVKMQSRDRVSKPDLKGRTGRVILHNADEPQPKSWRLSKLTQNPHEYRTKCSFDEKSLLFLHKFDDLGTNAIGDHTRINKPGMRWLFFDGKKWVVRDKWLKEPVIETENEDDAVAALLNEPAQINCVSGKIKVSKRAS